MKTYRILPGHSFRADDGRLLEAGDTMELSFDTAALHIGKVVVVAAEALVQASDQSASTDFATVQIDPA